MVKTYGNQRKVPNALNIISLTIISTACVLVSWNDLINLKPEGIEDSVQSDSISLALFGFIDSPKSELKEDDLVIEIIETSSGNLNITWRLKQILGITVSKIIIETFYLYFRSF